jgi:hypothetical protein
MYGHDCLAAIGVPQMVVAAANSCDYEARTLQSND